MVKSLQPLLATVRSHLSQKGYDFQENAELRGTITWKVDFYLPDNKTVIMCLSSADDFYKLMFIAQDLMQFSPITFIIISQARSFPYKYLQIARNYGIPILNRRNLKLIDKVISGDIDVEEINAQLQTVERRASRKVAEECRMRIYEMLKVRPLTEDEIVESLSTDFPERTIKWCLLTLKRQGKVRRLASLSGSRKAVYGVKEDQIFQIPRYYTVGKELQRKINSHRIIEFLNKAGRKGLTITEISNLAGLKISQVVAYLRFLENRGLVKRLKDKRKIRWKTL